MSELLRDLIPSMFQRRLFLLLGAVLCVCAVLGVKLALLTVVQGAERRDMAEVALTEEDLIPTVRGRIMDRRGRVLAQDVPSNDVAVMYHVINDQWPYERAHHEAYRANRTRWTTFDYTEKEELIAQYQPRFTAQVDAMWKTLCEIGHIDRAEIEQRKDLAKSRIQQITAFLRVHEHPVTLTDLDDPAPVRRAAQEVKEQREAQVVLSDVDDAALVKVRTLIAASDTDPDLEVWSQVSIKKSHRRDYPLETVDIQANRDGLPVLLPDDGPLPMHVSGVGMHVVGLLRPAYQQDIQQRPFVHTAGVTRDVDMGGYRPGDQVGSSGIEKSHETLLRGKLGEIIVHLDTGEPTIVDPIAGHDVTLTIDQALQARIQGLMEPSFGLMQVQEWHRDDPEHPPEDQPHRPVLGDALNGAAVVVDVATGQVLAAVSAPELSLGRLQDDRLHRGRDDPQAIWNDKINDPFLNRVVAESFQPGSTVKPMVLAAAVTDHQVGYAETINCRGYMDDGHPDRFRCWIFKGSHGVKTHGPLTGPEAIENSCNIFFFTMGQRLGTQRLTWWYSRFGLGHVLGCGLDEEISGSLPDIATPVEAPHADQQGLTSESTARLMGIGQGPIAWTPLQAANVYATLARGGSLITPTFILTPDAGHPPAGTLALDPHGVAEALQGLDMVVNEPTGTGNHLTVGDLPTHGQKLFNCPGVHVRGKSGTADAAELKVGGKVVRQGAHGWFIGLVNKDGEPRPKYAIAVVVEYGGSGGNVAGPVANQIVYALRDEGYL